MVAGVEELVKLIAEFLIGRTQSFQRFVIANPFF
jgi:hypothetical protein